MEKHLNKIIQGTHHDPFQVLGAHFSGNKEQTATIRTFQPHAKTINLLIDGKSLEMTQTHQEGFFEIILNRTTLQDPHLDPYSYQFQITYMDDNSHTCNDPYRFLPALEEKDRYLFNFGTHYELYRHMGAHPAMFSDITGIIFRVWAPAATRVSILGNFNSWDGRTHPMRSLGNSGIWELFLPGVGVDEPYKFEIRTQDGSLLKKIDPFQFFGELRPKTASLTHGLGNYQWHDETWQERKNQTAPYTQPQSTYEVHAGSWQRDPDEPDRFFTFRELAEKLIPYVKELGFTHIELMPVMEHPLDESWGYQVTAPFSLSSRFGTPQDFKYFVDQCHQSDIGVILDWVPAHFPRDAHSLARFDGTALFEHEDPRQGSHPDWGTLIYNYGRREISNFLIANALFWLDIYHIDGLRVDAVASMLYLDYSRSEGEWLPNREGGRENLEAIEFLRHLNSIVYDRFPNTLMIAEESTSFYGVSKPADIGGLGFGFKWNMGWMNDILHYFRFDPIHRKYHHNDLTFSITYAFSENFILPLSHDEVVHGKGSLINKMPGDDWQKFANLRLLLLGMWTHPGKKLLFMGCEFGQWREWDCKRGLDFHLFSQIPLHSQCRDFVRELNSLYRKHACLWEMDSDSSTFQWMTHEDRANSVISYARFGHDRRSHLVCLLNHTPQTLTDYRLPLPAPGKYELVLNSDSKHFGGSNVMTGKYFQAVPAGAGRTGFYCTITVPPLAGIILKSRPHP
ncbi:MAG: 1,4-alpha-glucan branching protein GlgB [Desulfobulbaceae bacterium]|uniref:1,4-alpha-glucan branching enzyme GlgB n=1 Tax=Candidatus Desulfatifera sulfidica TaxID=2841691 RepID=A0A8J6N9V0_9BACT|nr:1,4-alpha-glucan branching protein GlgB [Candidatus Desulfatifera sulfidica]